MTAYPLTTAEVARELGIAVRTAERWVISGRLRPCRTVGRTALFTPAELARVAALPRPPRGGYKPRRNRASRERTGAE